MPKVQVKIVYATNYDSAERELNKELAKLSKCKIRSVNVDTDWAGQEDHYICTIVYEV